MSLPLEVDVDRLERADLGRIESVVRAAVPGVAPTLALSAWHDGAPALELRAGWMDPETRLRPIRADALFDLASITKTVTATLFLRLVSVGRVGIDDPVDGVIPELAAAGPRTVEGGQEPLTRRSLPTPPEREGSVADPSVVTFRHLLTHTSGLAPWRSVFEACGPVPLEPGEVDPIAPADRHAAGIRAVVSYAFVDVPGRSYAYSDLGLMLLGETVRRLGGAPLDELVRTDAAARLGLNDLRFRPVDAGVDPERIVPTSVDELWRHRRCWGEVEDENCAGMGGIAGHAGLFATATDVARFGAAWLRRDPRLGIAAELIHAATSDLTAGLGVSRGLGWQLRGDRPGDDDAAHLTSLGPGAFGHTGFTGTSIAIDPSRRLVVVLLTNRVFASRTHEGIDELRRDLHEAIVAAIGP